MKPFIYLTIIFTGLLIISCKPDKKEDPISPSISIDERDKFIAYWIVNENSATAGANSHTVNIVKSTSAVSEVLINNFSGLSVSARASVNNNILTIPYQAIGSPTVIGFAKGSGTLTSANIINMTYTTTIASSKDSSSAIYTKQ